MTRVAKPKEWTPFDTLLRQIARDRFLAIAADDLTAMKLASDLIFDRLERNAWQARTASPENYRFTVSEGECDACSGNAIDLREGCVIERDFWNAFLEAQEMTEGLATLQPEGTWAYRQPDENSFNFLIAHPGRPTIAGAATGVEVRICNGELARKKRGRKLKSKTKEPRRDAIKFAALMDEVEERIRRGEGMTAAVAWARQEVKSRMIGNKHTEVADRQAIYRELKVRGL